MPVWRLQSSFGADTAFPRDRLVITPHFNDSGIGSDPQALCNDLAAAYKAWTPMGVREIRVTAYDAEGTVPVEPAGDKILDGATYPVSNSPRELAVCLSYYSQQNKPRYRGRLYIPFCMTANSMSGRVLDTVRTKVGALATIFADLGGPDVDWVVWSRSDGVARPVSNWWVDDEWDTVRSRGLRPSVRTVGTLTE